MSQVHLNAFIADVIALKAGSRFDRPSINIDDKYGWHTSVKGLIDHLRANFVGAAPMQLFDAVQRCGNPHDERLIKYMPAIERLVSVWGTHNAYPAIPAVTDNLRAKAMFNFVKALAPLPPALRPNWGDLDTRANDSAGFGMHLGRPYLHRVITPGQPALDMTARGLLLRAGLAPQDGLSRDGGYIEKLGLTQNELSTMNGRSILDVACGGAIFLAEMGILFNCATTGIDFNAAHVAAAILEGQRRYVKSMLYLKMLKDRNMLANAPIPPWSASLIDRIIPQLNPIINYYNANQPVQGNILHAGFTAAALAIQAGGWDYTTCMYLLCYFNQADQTTAVQNMCSVTNRTVFLFNGIGSVVPSLNLIYNQAAIQAAFPNCHINVIDAQTHRIGM